MCRMPGSPYARVVRRQQTRGVVGRDQPDQQLDVQGGRIVPEVEAWVVVDVLEPDKGEALAAVGLEPQPIPHLPVPDAPDEQVEPGPGDRHTAAEHLRVDVARRCPKMLRIGEELLDSWGADGQLEHEALPADPGVLVRLAWLGSTQPDVPLHLLGEAHRCSARTRPRDRFRRSDRHGLSQQRNRGIRARASGGPHRTSRLLQQPVHRPIGERGDRQRGVGADRAWHHRPVDDPEVVGAEHPTPAVDDALVLIAPHRVAAERMDGDHSLGPPQRVVHVPGVHGRGDPFHHRPHRREVGERRARGPVDLQPTLVQVHPTVGDVAAHPEHGHRARRQGDLPDRRREVAGDIRPATGHQSAGQQSDRRLGRARDDRTYLRDLEQPVQEAGIAGILDVEAAPGRAGAVAHVADPDRAGDHRAPTRREVPESGGRVDALLRVQQEADQVAVAAEPRPSGWAEPRERRLALQHQVSRAEGAGGQHQPAGPDHPVLHRSRAAGRPVGVDAGRWVVHAIAHLPQRPVAVEALDLVQRADIGAGVRGRREVGVVQGVLGTNVAADVAASAQVAGEAARPVDVAVPRLRHRIVAR